MAGALLLFILSILALFAAGRVARGTNTTLVMFWLLVATILLSASAIVGAIATFARDFAKRFPRSGVERMVADYERKAPAKEDP
jgi:uncharacterized membrane protein YdjX (TVP38/TMEM64 family)